LVVTKKHSSSKMQTKFVEIDLPRSQLPNSQLVPETIETLLQAWGQPLRWAITRVDSDYLHIEATLTSVEP
jgi:hypothetical protein